MWLFGTLCRRRCCHRQPSLPSRIYPSSLFSLLTAVIPPRHIIILSVAPVLPCIREVLQQSLSHHNSIWDIAEGSGEVVSSGRRTYALFVIQTPTLHDKSAASGLLTARHHNQFAVEQLACFLCCQRRAPPHHHRE